MDIEENSYLSNREEDSIDVDFSSDDYIADPTFSRKRTLSPSTSSGSIKRTKFDEVREKKLLFNGTFYSEVKQLNSTDNLSAVCQECKKIIKGSFHVTSNFTKHLKKMHSESFDQYIALKKSNGDCSNKSGGQNRQAMFDKRLIDFIVDTISPLSIVEKESFIQLFKGTGLTVRSRPKIMDLLNNAYDEMSHSITSAMKSSKYFCTTADVWSASHRSFLGYTCHWLDNNFERQSVALACKRFSGTHSAERIADLMSEINTKFHLNHRNIVATITDNGSNFVKAFKEFGIDNFEFDDEELPEFSCVDSLRVLPKHVRCASHTLNLLATTDYLKIVKRDTSLYNRHLQAFKNCNNLWRKTSWPKSSEVIANTLGQSLTTPVVTRWNSTYDAVSNILLHCNKLGDLCSQLSIHEFSENDVQYLKEYCIVMKPLAELLDHLQKEKNIVFGDLMPALATLKTKLKKVRLSESLMLLGPTILQLEENLVNRFRAYYYLKPEANDAIVAAVLCPKIKTKWFKVFNDIPHHRTIDDIHALVRSKAEQEAEVNGSLEGDEGTYAESAVPPTKEDFYDFDEDSTSLPITTSSSSLSLSRKIEYEYSTYINDPSVGNGMAMLDKYSFLKKLSLKLNTPLTSSAPVERLFSFASMVNSPRRHALTDEHFQKLVLLKANSTFLKNINKK